VISEDTKRKQVNNGKPFCVLGIVASDDRDPNLCRCARLLSASLGAGAISSEFGPNTETTNRRRPRCWPRPRPGGGMPRSSGCSPAGRQHTPLPLHFPLDSMRRASSSSKRILPSADHYTRGFLHSVPAAAVALKFPAPHIREPVWPAFSFDVSSAFSSILLAVFFFVRGQHWARGVAAFRSEFHSHSYPANSFGKPPLGPPFNSRSNSCRRRAHPWSGTTGYASGGCPLVTP